MVLFLNLPSKHAKMKVVVPIDFTTVTENALKYAIGLSETLPVNNITLFHVVAADKDMPAADSNLKKLIEKYKDTKGVTFESNIATGNIFDQIGKAALQMKAALIIMGTHGIKGMQRIIGSRAMRVITQSETPYIVVQQRPYRKIQKILVPVDSSKEGKQLLPLLEKLNQKFKASLLLTKQITKDEFINNKINNNLSHFKAYLGAGGISYADAGTYTSSSKYKDVLNEAGRSDSDLLVATIDPETDITDYVMGVEEQKIVANELQIPVLCVNIKHFMNRKGGIFELM
jgi:nucleotide-binding universal stress UspA family protein